MYSGTWLSSSDYQAANNAVDIARENAVTAAALATALATINTLTLANSQLTTQKNTLAGEKRVLTAEKNTAVTNLATHLALPHYTAQQQSLLPILNTGGGGTTQTTTMFVQVPIVPAIVSFSPASGIRGSNADIIGTFDYVNGGSIKVGNETAAVVSVNQTQGRIVFTIPNGVNSGNGNSSNAPNLITYTSLGGSSTSGTPFTVTEPANALITVQYHVYVGTRVGSSGDYAYPDWNMDTPTSFGYYNQLEITTQSYDAAGVATGAINYKVYMRSPGSTFTGLTSNQINGPYPAAAVYLNGLSYNDGWVQGSFTMPKNDGFKVARYSSLSNATAAMADSIKLTGTQIYRRSYNAGVYTNSGFIGVSPYNAQISADGFIRLTDPQLSGQTLHIWSGATALIST